MCLTDYLQRLGVTVRHIIDSEHTQEHALNPQARWQAPYLIYDQPSQGSLTLDS